MLNEQKIEILLASPLPPPYGGITNWTRIMVSELETDKEIRLSMIDISLKKGSGDRRISSDISSFLRMISGAKKEIEEVGRAGKGRAVLHICSSGGKGVIRDLALIKLASRNGVPVVLHFHYGRVPDLWSSRSFLGRLLRKSITCSSACVAMDRRTFSFLNSVEQTVNCYLIPNPISREIRNKKDGGPDNQIAFVGHVERLKGIEDLLKAWEGARKFDSECKLKVIGPVQDDYRRYLSETYCMRRVDLLGPLDHASTMEEISKSRALVLPSYTEGFPNVVLEAFALEIPVIATSVGALPEMLSNKAGLMIEPGDVCGLMDALRGVLAHRIDVTSITRSARNKIDQEYGVDIVEKRLKECWKSVLGTR